ncbi:MAG: aspartate aminotransferase family protein [Gammaproteobacteria bacterium]|jgi:L-2,4-diaminobutyrate decarboxylase|nr:aspartate aminotransferase family protein [Gammaproteobacteria bacterium]MBT5600794.1 aspartate aminotransferase family protein [Gammaproteobacteria bacterium]MBT6244489.1 aspartate aminotransferase family protein [Gammaproteobacteria bacterium]
MHRINTQTLALRKAVLDYSVTRMDYDPVPLDRPEPNEKLAELVGETMTDAGIGWDKALDLFRDVLAPATISADHPNFLSFIPAAPTEAASLFDLVVSASSIYGGSWKEGAGAIFAENQVLEFLARECGLAEGAGGVFVQGGTLGNLSALVTARQWAKAQGKLAPWAIICSAEAHSSLAAAARVMDVEIIIAEPVASGKFNAAAADNAIAKARDAGLTPFALVGTAGTTNFGIVDRLDELAATARKEALWFHVDGAYGLAGVLSTEHKGLYRGIEKCDSFIVDPHKWLFAPFDACALVYRKPEYAKQAHTQQADYLDAVHATGDWNPSDYAFNLTRRARGLPLWFSLATYGVEIYRQAVSRSIYLARQIADVIEERDYLELLRPPELSVVVFERKGWDAAQYEQWSEALLDSQFAFVVPSSHQGRPNTRFAIVNPRTEFSDLVKILDSMA